MGCSSITATIQGNTRTYFLKNGLNRNNAGIRLTGNHPTSPGTPRPLQAFLCHGVGLSKSTRSLNIKILRHKKDNNCYKNVKCSKIMI